MKIVRVQDIIGTEREVEGPGWVSRRMLLKKDGMGFSFHETIIPAGAELNLWYKHHLEAVYCVAGNGKILDKATGETHEITDGTLYAATDTLFTSGMILFSSPCWYSPVRSTVP